MVRIKVKRHIVLRVCVWMLWLDHNEQSCCTLKACVVLSSGGTSCDAVLFRSVGKKALTKGLVYVFGLCHFSDCCLRNPLFGFSSVTLTDLETQQWNQQLLFHLELKTSIFSVDVGAEEREFFSFSLLLLFYFNQLNTAKSNLSVYDLQTRLPAVSSQHSSECD